VTLSPSFPDWIELRAGRVPIVLLAPHGGRRVAPRRPGRDKVNDLHTADLTRELAAACDATSIVNARRDRNELDLNRITAVRERAPWLLELLADRLECMVAQHGRATLVVVHGWNVVQAACDVGIGMVEREGGCVPATTGHPTAGAEFLRDRLRPLQRRAVERDVIVTIGARYPAAHPNNLLQLFAAAVVDREPPLRRIAALAARVDAVQLELGIPLRWPGPRRRAFTELLVAMLSDVAAAAPAADDATPGRTDVLGVAVRCGGRATRRRVLQFVAGDLLGMTSMEIGDGAAIAGRLLLSPGPGRLALFTGELAAAGLAVPALAYHEGDGGLLDVGYEGSMLEFPALTPFLDLEDGLARGALIEAALAVRFAPEHVVAERAAADQREHASLRARFGTLRGTLTLDGARHDIATVACATSAGLAGGSGRVPALRLTLPETPLGPCDLVSSGAEAQPAGLRAPTDEAFVFAIAGATSNGTLVTGRCDLTIGARSGSLRLTVRGSAGEHDVTGVLERVIPVRRPGRAGSVIEIRYALCRCPTLAPGWIELSVERFRGA
jgi:hypothetical protein